MEEGEACARRATGFFYGLVSQSPLSRALLLCKHGSQVRNQKSNRMQVGPEAQ